MRSQFWQTRNKPRFLLVTGIIIIICLTAAFHIVQRYRTAVSQSARAGSQTTVDVLTVKRADLVKRISLTGATVPKSQVDIAAKYQGRVTAVYVDLGTPVAPGQILVEQDTGDADLSILQNQAAYRQAASEAVTSEASFQASYDKAIADYHRAAAGYQRYKVVYDAGGISKEDLDTSAQQMADAKAALDALVNQMNSGTSAVVDSAQAAAVKARHSVSAAEKQRTDLILTAPRSGVIGYRQVEAGDIVSAGQKLLSIVDNSNIYVDCQVAEQDLAALSVGLNVDVQVESLGKTFAGEIIYISPANDSQTQSFSLRIGLINPDSTVRGGMFTRSIVNAVLRPATLAVPKDAVLEKNGECYVFVATAQNTIEQRPVQVGARGDQMVEILSGLEEGEQVAVSNLARLRSGMAVVTNQVAPDDGGAGN